jgi:formylglycine-generating enzyme required for sulfatase activity
MSLRSLLGLFGLLLAAAVAGACGNGDRCTPGQSAACTCASGASGAQTCGAGERFGPCVCAAADAGADGGDAEPRDADAADADAPDAPIEDADGGMDAEPLPHCRTPPEGFVRIPAGISLMGSDPSEPASRPDERPQHEVEITRPFWMQATEVTQEQWSALMGDNPSEFEMCGATCPVENVSWHRALDYANALSRSCGLAPCYPDTDDARWSISVDLACEGFRLPTEAEWEHAARAGAPGSFHTGTSTLAPTEMCEPILDPIGWYRCNAGGTTHPVGQLLPNPWGLYDMHGNVAEWVTDGKALYPDPAMRRVDPHGPPLSALDDRVARGGDWHQSFQVCRAAVRVNLRANEEFDFFGVRVIRAVPPGE